MQQPGHSVIHNNNNNIINLKKEQNRLKLHYNLIYFTLFLCYVFSVLFYIIKCPRIPVFITTPMLSLLSRIKDCLRPDSFHATNKAFFILWLYVIMIIYYYYIYNPCPFKSWNMLDLVYFPLLKLSLFIGVIKCTKFR